MIREISNPPSVWTGGVLCCQGAGGSCFPRQRVQPAQLPQQPFPACFRLRIRNTARITARATAARIRMSEIFIAFLSFRRMEGTFQGEDAYAEQKDSGGIRTMNRSGG